MSYITHRKRFTRNGHHFCRISRRRFRDEYTFSDTLHAVSLLADHIGGGDRLHKWMTSNEAAPLEPWASAAVVQLAKCLARKRRRILLTGNRADCHRPYKAGAKQCYKRYKYF